MDRIFSCSPSPNRSFHRLSELRPTYNPPLFSHEPVLQPIPAPSNIHLYPSLYPKILIPVCFDVLKGGDWVKNREEIQRQRTWFTLKEERADVMIFPGGGDGQTGGGCEDPLFMPPTINHYQCFNPSWCQSAMKDVGWFCEGWKGHKYSTKI
jgi:hypothetical protein